MRLVAAIALALLVALPAEAAPFWGKPTADEQRSLETGEVLISHRTVPGTSVLEFTAMGIVKAPVEALVRFYADPKSVPKYQDAIKKQEILKQDPHRARIRYLVGLPWPMGDRQFSIDIWDEDRFVEWLLVDGNVRENKGSYAMADLGGGRTLVTYHVLFDMNLWVPPFLIAWAQRGMIPKVILKAREELEAG